MCRPKVFAVGFHKTGTKSIGAALAVLGYRVAGQFGVNHPRISEIALAEALKRAKHFDAFQDNPWPILFRQLDSQFPGSRFILTLRPSDSWIESVVRHFGTRSTTMREWIYGAGSPRGSEQIYIERYQQHNREVRNYFRDRPGDLLTMRITEGNGWEALCPFLGMNIPARGFPHVNAGRVQDNSV